MSVHVLKNTLRWVLRCTVMALPLIVTSKTLFPFIVGKILLLHVGSILSILLGALLCSSASFRKKLIDIIKHPLVIAWILYVFSITISSLLSSDVSRAWWSTLERGLGVITYGELTAIFILWIAVHDSAKAKLRSAQLITASGIVVALIALLRLFGFALFGVDTGLRLAGSLGNPIFLGGVMLWYAFIAWYAMQNDSARWARKAIYIVCIILFMTVMFHTQTRGVLLAITSGLCAFFSVYIFHSKKILKNAGLALAILIITGVPLIYFRHSIAPHVPVLQRIVSTNLKDASLLSRFESWEAGWNAFKEKPVFGWGNDQFITAFDAHYPPDLLRFGFNATRFDRAHNVIVEHITQFGIVGTLLYLAFFVGIMWYVLSNRKKYSKQMLAGFFAIIVAHNVHLLTAFDTPVALILMLVGVALLIDNNQPKVSSDNNKITPIALVSALSLVCIGVWLLGINPYQASVLNARALQLSARGDIQQAHQLLMQAEAITQPYHTQIRLDTTRNATSLAQTTGISQELKRTILTEAMEMADKNIHNHPEESFFPYIKSVLMLHNFADNHTELEKALPHIDQAITLSNRQQYYFIKSDIYSTLGKHDASVEVLEQAVALSQKAPISQWFLGLKLLQIDRFEEGQAHIFASIENGYIPNNFQDKLDVAVLYRDAGQPESAAVFMTYALAHDRLNPQLWAEFAVYLQEANWTHEASQAAQFASSIDPSYAQEAQVFIESLGEISNTAQLEKATGNSIEKIIHESLTRPNEI